jgi:transcriptional regulator with XRE-family HTH domain
MSRSSAETEGLATGNAAAQIRAARALLGWRQADLAGASGVSEMTIKNIERGAGEPRLSTLRALVKAFARAGVRFVDADEHEPSGLGVRFIAYDGPSARLP